MSKPICCPFKVGDRIHELSQGFIISDFGKNTIHYPPQLDMCRPDAIVTELTPCGFKYVYKERVVAHPRFGIAFDGGECFPNGYHTWRKVKRGAERDSVAKGFIQQSTIISCLIKQ